MIVLFAGRLYLRLSFIVAHAISLLIFTFPICAARPVPDGGVSGILHIARPLDACTPLKNRFQKEEALPSFVLISRGTCNFDKKVQNAQDAGFQAAIVYNSMDSFDELVTSKSLW